MSGRSTPVAARALALLLLVGGVLGIVTAIMVGQRLLRAHWIYAIIIAAFIYLFAWSALTGFRLWRGDPRGWKWATILFAMQVPVLTVPGLSYEYYTGISTKIMGGHVGKHFDFSLGANAQFYLDTRIVHLLYGVNLFALAATVYLLLIRLRGHRARKTP